MSSSRPASSKTSSNTAEQFRFVDLFAGIGGFHAALSALGGECVYAVEKDPAAAAVYERNWGMPALGFGMEDVALIRPCVDIFDPRVVRASMGSLFSLRVHVYDDFEAYRAAYPAHGLYPFMLDGSSSLPDVLAGEIVQPYALIFGNEGSGLPASFAALGQPVRIPSNDRVDSLNLSIAAAIGIYGFTQKEAAHGAA